MIGVKCMKLKFRAEAKDLVIFGIFCLVLLYFVAIAVINLNSFAMEGVFRGLNPFPAFGSEFIIPTIVFYIVALLALMLACSSYFFEREEGFGITTEKKSTSPVDTVMYVSPDGKIISLQSS